jgi:hypothetical protein
MNRIKKFLGVVWMLLGPAAIVFLSWQAGKKLTLATATTNDWLQWCIIIFIFTPVAIGMVIFGWYAWNNEYDRIEES